MCRYLKIILHLQMIRIHVRVCYDSMGGEEVKPRKMKLRKTRLRFAMVVTAVCTKKQ